MIIDLDKFRKEKTGDPDLQLVEYDDDTEMCDLVYLTVDGRVVVLVKEMRGMHLTSEQAQDLGTNLIRYAALADHVDAIQKD